MDILRRSFRQHQGSSQKSGPQYAFVRCDNGILAWLGMVPGLKALDRLMSNAHLSQRSSCKDISKNNRAGGMDVATGIQARVLICKCTWTAL
eukprot:1152588-Pelagomonas_calceolata.AAC.3